MKTERKPSIWAGSTGRHALLLIMSGTKQSYLSGHPLFLCIQPKTGRSRESRKNCFRQRHIPPFLIILCTPDSPNTVTRPLLKSGAFSLRYRWVTAWFELDSTLIRPWCIHYRDFRKDFRYFLTGGGDQKRNRYQNVPTFWCAPNGQFLMEMGSFF